MTEPPILVVLPTHTKPSYNQQILGKRSLLSPHLDEFRGIPFGYVPGRWQHSHVRKELPVDKYKAWSNGPKCPQLPDLNNSELFFQSHLEYPADVGESELECLNLLIIRPSATALKKIEWDEAEKLPVFIWIHGGGYGFGASTDPMWGMKILPPRARGRKPAYNANLDPSCLVLEAISLGKPIIAVNINYRLGIFGFAGSSEILQAQSTSAIRGCNFGLRDQKVGLAWISQNIAAFGGDRRKITIGGQSAGASSTHAHVLDAINRKEQPLFRHACIQSGAVGTLGPITMAQADHRWEALCQNLKIVETPTRSMLDGLLNSSAGALLEAARDLDWQTFPLVEDNLTLQIKRVLNDRGARFTVNLGDVIDGRTASSPGNIAILIGDTELEGSIFRHHVDAISSVSEIRSRFFDSLTSSDTAKKLLSSYGITVGTSPNQLTAGLLCFLTDTTCSYHVVCARESFTNQRLPNNSHPVIAAALVDDDDPSKPESYQSTTVQNYKIRFGNPFPGPDFEIAQHCVELIYLFDAFHDQLAIIDAEINTRGIVEEDVSNAALVAKLQRQWILFIVEDQKADRDESEITIYETDRSVSTSSLHDWKDWVRQEERFAMLAAEWKGVTEVLKDIIGIGYA